MRRIAFLALAVALMLPCVAAGKSFRLKYAPDLSEEMGSPSYSLGAVAVTPVSRFDGIKSEPTYVSDKPIYFMIVRKGLENGMFLVADESKGTGKGYDTLYVDVDGDLDIAEEKAIKASVTGEGSRRTARFKPFNVTTKSGKATVPCHMQFTVTTYKYEGRDDRHYCSAKVKGGFVGTVKVKKTHKLILADTNGDGEMCGNVAEEFARLAKADGPAQPIYLRGDVLLIDIDGDGTISTSYSSTDRVPCGVGVTLDGMFMKLDPADGLKSIAVTRPKIKTGRIVGIDSLKDAQLISKDALVKLDAETKSIICPAGDYYLISCSVEKTDAKGRWLLRGKGSTAGPVFKVVAGKTLKLSLGEKITPVVTVSPSIGEFAGVVAVKRGSSLSMSLALVGAQGETFSPPMIYPKEKGSPARPEAPTVTVTNGDGKEVGSGKFTYG